MEKILAEERAEEWEVSEEVLALPAPELHEALEAGKVVNLVQREDITFSEDAEWRGMVEVPQDLWEANNQMNLSMLSTAVVPTFGIKAQSVKPGEVCIRALADWAARLGESTEKILKADGEIWHARGNGSCMFHCILNANSPRIAHKLRCILADFESSGIFQCQIWA